MHSNLDANFLGEIVTSQTALDHRESIAIPRNLRHFLLNFKENCFNFDGTQHTINYQATRVIMLRNQQCYPI